MIVLGDELLYCSGRVAKAEPKPASKRRSTQSKGTTRAKRVGRVVLFFFLAIVVVDALVGDRGFMAMLRVRRQYDELTLAIAQQRAENARLREEARRLREDPSAIEELARRELGLIRPGEKVFILKDLKTPPAR